MLVGTTDEIDQKLVATRFSTLSIMFTLAFSLAVLYTIWDYARGNAQSADDLKISLSTIETALGAFLGLIVETLFGKVSPLPQKPETPLQAEA
ncbi:hypothetical protein GCM10007937_01790 [Mesorhizobium albiziae]|nr:hypothetical protein GCM10007937_01790 [Mesorhizobium albiziae]